MSDKTKNITSKMVAGTYSKYFRWLELNELKGSRSVPRGGV
ncbi:hypothetical protein [Candidatus Tisiphia endosymbiont of Thecophora atra]